MDTLSASQKSLFTGWRCSVYLSMFFGWSCHILIRKNMPSTMPSLMEHQGFTRSDIGMISSCFAVSYGCSKFVGALVSDHVSPQKVFSFGLVMVGLCSLVFPLASNLMLACTVWLTAGIVQGCGWPPCVLLLKAWYPPSHIGRWWSLLSCSGSVVSAFLPLTVVFLTSTLHWSASYYIFGLYSVSMGILVLFTIKDTPKDIGLALSFGSDSTTTKNKNENDASHSSAASLSQGKKGWYGVFFIFDLWVVSVVYIILNLVNYCALNWSQLYFVQMADFTETSAAACYSLFQVGAIMGNFIAGYISDLFITPVSFDK